MDMINLYKINEEENCTQITIENMIFGLLYSIMQVIYKDHDEKGIKRYFKKKKTLRMKNQVYFR